MRKLLRRFRARLHTRTGVRTVVLFALVVFTVNLSIIANAREKWATVVPVRVPDPILRRVMLRRFRRSVTRTYRFARVQTGSTVFHPAAPDASGAVVPQPVEFKPVLAPQIPASSSVSSSASSSHPAPVGEESASASAPRLAVPSSAPPVPASSSVASSSAPAALVPSPARSSAAASSAVGSSSSTPQPVVPAGSSSAEAFPAFGSAVFPVSHVPNWGAMTTPAEWDRTFAQLKTGDFVSVPGYDLSVLTIPLKNLEDRRTPQEVAALTAKLFYSTRYYGAYDLDAGEFTGAHPGVDLKLALGTPIGAIGGGIVRYAGESGLLGLHVIIEHRMPDGSTYDSIYGHFGSISVHEGDVVRFGQILGTVGMTGSTSGPHLHLQIDRGEPGEAHVPYTTTSVPSREAAKRWTVSPVTFIEGHK